MLLSVVPVIPVTRIEHAAEVLNRVGFTENWVHVPGGTPLRYASYVNKDAGLELHVSESRGDGTGPVVTYFWVDDIDALAVQAGEVAADQTWGTREFWLRDQDANTYRFGQRL
jgi:hypothetical protein